MIIVMNNSATDEEIDFVVSRIKEKGLDASISKGTEKTVIGAVGDERLLDPKLLDNLPGVEQALRIVKPYKIVAREWHPEDTVIDINLDVNVGINTSTSVDVDIGIDIAEY